MAENGASNIYGINIYHFKNQTVYYDWLERTPFIIPNSQASSFTKWQLRDPIAIVIACIMVLLKINVVVVLVLLLVAMVILEIVFRVKYLPELPIAGKFKKPESLGLFGNIARFYPRETFKSLALMFAGMAIVMFFLSFIFNKYEGINAIISWIFIVVTIIISLIMFYLLKKRDTIA